LLLLIFVEQNSYLSVSPSSPFKLFKNLFLLAQNEPELLDSPIWILIINIVALEMLKAKLPPGKHHAFKTRDKITLDMRRWPDSALGDAQGQAAAR
jgi:hypothetical protein